MTSSRELLALLNVALGKQPYDTVVRGTRLVNVMTGESYAADVGIAFGRVAFVGRIPASRIGRGTEVVDWSGRFLLPGFIDSHIHVSGSHLSPGELGRTLLQHGTTTIATDFEETYSYAGPPGVRLAIDEARRVGLRIWFLPPVHLIGTERHGSFRHKVSVADMEAMLDWPETIGINEPPAAAVLGRDRGLLRLLAVARNRHKVVTGHAPEVHGAELQAYTALGASSCHESTNASQVVEKVRIGMWPMLRYGSASRDLPSAVRFLDQVPSASRWMMLCADEQDPVSLGTNGNVNYMMKVAVANGVDPHLAVAAGTINPAVYFGQASELGSVAPGKSADLVAVRDLLSFEVTDVIARGQRVIKDGEFIRSQHRSWRPSVLKSRVSWPRRVVAKDFAVRAKGSRARVRVIGVSDGTLVSRRLVATLPVSAGNIVGNPSKDILKAAVIDRHSGRFRVGFGFVRGLGLRDSAFATTCCHVHQNVLVVGTSDDYMVRAANALAKLGGGFVVIRAGQLIAQWSLSIAGVLSHEPIEQVQASFRQINQALTQCGCPLSSPIQGISFMALTTIPEYGLTDRGLYDVNGGRFVALQFSETA